MLAKLTHKTQFPLKASKLLSQQLGRYFSTQKPEHNPFTFNQKHYESFIELSQKKPIPYYSKIALSSAGVLGTFAAPEDLKSYFISASLLGLTLLAMDKKFRLNFQDMRAEIDEDNSKIYNNANK